MLLEKLLSNILFHQFWWNHVSVSCSCVVFCWSPSTSKFNVLCIHLHTLVVLHTSCRHLYIENCCSLDTFSFFSSFSVNHRDDCLGKSQQISSFLNILTLLTQITMQPCSESLLPHSDALFSFQYILYMTKATQLLPYEWIIIYLC